MLKMTETPATLWIGGARRAAASGGRIEVRDPATGEVFTYISAGGAGDVDAAIRDARACADAGWAVMDPLLRGRLLIRLGALIEANREELAAIESRDVGKPMKQARADVDACARYFEFYGTAADKLHGETIPYRPGYTVMVVREPWGVTGHIIPWNYPMQIMGRTVGRRWRRAMPAWSSRRRMPRCRSCASPNWRWRPGLPPGAFNVVTGYGAEAGAALAGHPDIDHISFTGSPGTGAAVQQAAARNNVSVTMELGGKSPQIVFADADLDAAVPTHRRRHCAERRADLLRRLAPAGGALRGYDALIARLIPKPSRAGRWGRAATISIAAR
jgi:aldehyde dehydrogenase (NAD+)